ncbi:putative ADP-ribosylation factor GTPase-activating protein AGD14 [Trifolium repens]|nr:putative ADP-ribosylation factor GTPase-activating protein AGD14 [Trifolium repens]
MELLPYQIIETDLPMQIEMVQLFEKDQQMKDDETDARFYPLLLDNLLGLKIVAKGTWSPTFTSIFVDIYSANQNLVTLMET